jgi:uncharacterized protein (TIGR00369 family)
MVVDVNGSHPDFRAAMLVCDLSDGAVGFEVYHMSAVYLPYTHGCFVCGASNEHGLQLKFRFEDGEIRADFQPRPHHAGYKGMVHGGVTASALDEAMFWAAAYATRKFHVSVELTVRYLKKVEVGQRHLLVARLAREQRKFCFTESELRDSTGEPCATATGKYFPMRPEDVPLGAEDFFADARTISPMEFFPGTR